jgi:hypothetical protein
MALNFSVWKDAPRGGVTVWSVIYVPEGYRYRTFETRDAGYVQLDKPYNNRSLFRW